MPYVFEWNWELILMLFFRRGIYMKKICLSMPRWRDGKDFFLFTL